MPTILWLPKWCIWLLLALVILIGFFHLRADFPNHSRYADDAAKYTDEGWWASGAIRHTLTGHWLVNGDYNPIIAVPLWSAVLGVIFHFTGVSIVAARSAAFLFTIGTILVCGRLLYRRHGQHASAFMLLIASSPILFFFSRQSLLEPALVFFLVAAAWAAYSDEPPGILRSVVCGVLFTLAMLTKTSALFVAPAILYLVWFPHRPSGVGANRSERVNGAKVVRSLFVCAITFVLCYSVYWAALIHKHPADMQVFYHETQPVLDFRSVEKAARLVYRCFTWLDPVLFPTVVLGLLIRWNNFRSIWIDPLFGFAALFFLGYSAFMILHFDAEPHYFAVLVVPLMFMAFLMVLHSERSSAYSTLMRVALLIAMLSNLIYVGRHMAHPDYSLRDACLNIRNEITADAPRVKPLIIGHGAMETALFTGIPALDDLGRMTVREKIDTFHPGWVVIWSDNLDLLQCPGVAPSYSFAHSATFSVMDNPRRSELLLYQIVPQQ